MGTNHQNTLRMGLNRTVALNTARRSVFPQSPNRLNTMGYQRRVPGFFPMPVAQKQELETDSPAATQFEPAASNPAPSVLTLYLREVGQLKLLSPEEEAALALRIRGGDEAAREQMIKANLRLVVAIAHAFDGMGLALLDLISEGNIGLMKAVDRFDPARGARLSTYASLLIKQGMLRALSSHARTIRVPEDVYIKSQIIHSAAGRLQELLGRDPTDDEIAQETGLPASRVQSMREAAQPILSLDAPLNGSPDVTLAELLPEGNSTSAEETFADSATVRNLEDFLGQLRPREQSILRSRFGMEGGEEKTLQEIGRQLGLQRERVRQIQNGALQKLRKKFKAQKLLRLAARCDICHWSTSS